MAQTSLKKSCIGRRCSKCTSRSCVCAKCAEGGSRRSSRHRNQRGGDCGCSGGRQSGGRRQSSRRQSGGRVTNASEYYGIDSGRYDAGNTATPYLDDINAQRTSALANTASMTQTVQSGGSCKNKKDKRSSRRRRNAPKYSPKYSNRSRYLIHSRSKKSRKSSK